MKSDINLGSSPWGTITHVTQHERGISTVSTAGHGGIRIAFGYAEKHLSKQALSRGIIQGKYYFFEEDCLYAIPLWELPFLWSSLWPNQSHDQVKENLLFAISLWNADYLISIGEVPLPEPYAQYLERLEEDSLRKSNSPDLIVSAINADPNTVEVVTANRERYFVTAESYKALGGLKLLSKCVKVMPPEGYQSRYRLW